VAGAAASAAWLLPACGASAGSSTVPAASLSPKAGGTLRAGLTGGGNSDTIDALNVVSNVMNSMVTNVYEPLLGQRPDTTTYPRLAEEFTPNADATEWTIRLRPGITWHDGKDFTADDVIYTFRKVLNPKSPGSGAAMLAPIDAANLKKRDKLTLVVPCKTPFSTLPSACATNPYGYIVPEGYTYKPDGPYIGTGPFKIVSFTPGTQTVMKRNPDYWQSGLPYLDEVVITDFADETSQVNALLSGQVDVVNYLSSSVMASVTGSGKKLLTSQGGGFNPFTMRVDVAPFKDVRVRQAMRLIVDRHEMMNVVFSGHGTIGNDVFSIWDTEYNKNLPQRQQDIEQAKSLLKSAGYEGMKIQLVTADIAQGVVDMAQVFAKQASQAGVTVNIRKVTVNDMWGTNYLEWTFAQDFWQFIYYLPQVAMAFLPNSAYNEVHWNDPHYNQLYNEALATVDEAKRTEICHELQQIDYDQGGYIIPLFPPVIDGYAANVQGLVPSKTGLPLNAFGFKQMWLS
jgi:peptide/nickel transport system substrate-binding protein